MKSLYETILSSTRSGAKRFLLRDFKTWNTSHNFAAVFNISKMKRELEEEYGITLTKRMKDGEVITRILLNFVFTPEEWKILTKNPLLHEIDIDKILKEKFKPYTKKANFRFTIDHMGIDVGLYEEGEERPLWIASINSWRDLDAL